MAREVRSNQVIDDADAIYERAFEAGGVIAVDSVSELARDWRPLSRAAAASAYLVQNGWAEFSLLGGRRSLRLINPLDALSDTCGESA